MEMACPLCAPSDPGLLREELAEIYTHDFVPLSTSRRARWIIGEIARLVGLSREEVIATAKADAEYLLLTSEAV
jgi:hypothetical protein